jgi:hypothetical protein
MAGTVTQPTLSQARATVTESLRGGTIRNPITHDDVLKAVQAIAALPPREARALMAELGANGKLKTLVNEAMDNKSFSLGGLSAGERQTFFAAMVKSLDGASLARLGTAFDAADNGFNGYNAAQDMARAVATFGTAQMKLDYIAELSAKSTDKGSVNSAGIGGSVSINADAEASAIGTVLSSLRGANADLAFSRLSKPQLEAVILSSVNSTVSISGGMVMTGASVTASWNAKDFTSIMRAAQSVTNPATRAAIMEAAVGQYMNVMTAKNSLGYTVIGQPQTLNTMAAAIKGFSGGAKLPDLSSVPVTKDELALDVLQISLDVIGIISLGRGDGLGAFLSAVGIVPYLGDLAKAGKLGKWAATIEKAIELAKTDPAFLAKIRPALDKLNYALGKMGDAMPDALKGMKNKLDDLLRVGGDKVDDLLSRATAKLGGRPLNTESLNELFKAGTLSMDEARALASNANWKSADGTWIYPPNGGVEGLSAGTNIGQGSKIDRYGGRIDARSGEFIDTGRYTSPVGASYSSRALPPGTNEGFYKSYIVLKPIPADAGTATAWFGEVGGATQFKTELTIEQLKNGGFIREIK